MHLSKPSNKIRAAELVLSVQNVLGSRNFGLLSDSKTSEIFFDLAEKNQDLVLNEHEDPEIRAMLRPIRIMLLPFSSKPFV